MTSLDLRPEDPVAKRLLRSIGGIEPDPLFRRRLRGRVLNQHVAAREGLARADDRPRQMGRLGRGVLMASLALAVSVGAAAASSQEALPGDLLYPMKLQIEEIRLRAAPAWMREGLELAALDERLDEVEKLATSDRWTDLYVAVDEAVAIRAHLSTTDAIDDRILAEHTVVLQQLLTEVPERGRVGIERALKVSNGRGVRATSPQHPAHPAHPRHPVTPDNAAVPPTHAANPNRSATGAPTSTAAAPSRTASSPAASPSVGTSRHADH